MRRIDLSLRLLLPLVGGLEMLAGRGKLGTWRETNERLKG
jgi:hypothetical protein